MVMYGYVAYYHLLCVLFRFYIGYAIQFFFFFLFILGTTRMASSVKLKLRPIMNAL